VRVRSCSNCSARALAFPAADTPGGGSVDQGSRLATGRRSLPECGRIPHAVLARQSASLPHAEFFRTPASPSPLEQQDCPTLESHPPPGCNDCVTVDLYSHPQVILETVRSRQIFAPEERDGAAQEVTALNPASP